jgi:hypothetical protein
MPGRRRFLNPNRQCVAVISRRLGESLVDILGFRPVRKSDSSSCLVVFPRSDRPKVIGFTWNETVEIDAAEKRL